MTKATSEACGDTKTGLIKSDTRGWSKKNKEEAILRTQTFNNYLDWINNIIETNEPLNIKLDTAKDNAEDCLQSYF